MTREDEAGDQAAHREVVPAVLVGRQRDAAHEVVARRRPAGGRELARVREELGQRGVDLADTLRQGDRAEAEPDRVGPAPEALAILARDADQLAQAERRVGVGERVHEVAPAAGGEQVDQLVRGRVEERPQALHAAGREGAPHERAPAQVLGAVVVQG